MKKFFLLFFLCLHSISSKSQEPWRTITFNNVSGLDFKGNKFTMFSTNLHYDLNKKYFITSWNGLYTEKGKNVNGGWFGSQTTFNRYLKKDWNVGFGGRYGSSPPPNGFVLTNNSLYIITTVSYRVKLR